MAQSPILSRVTIDQHTSRSSSISVGPISQSIARCAVPTSATNSSDRSMSKSTPKYEVFLGGSCNPTTWREDVAIPLLKRKGISFYNPQVAHWEEALVEQEHQAKKKATILFYVFDPSTRNVASMVEAGFMAGCRRKLITVINHYSGPGQLISGEPISKHEYEELTGALTMVQDLVERQELPVFNQIIHAITCTAKILKENGRPQDLGENDDVIPIRYPYLFTREALLEVHDAFVNANSRTITLAEASVVFKVICGREYTQEEMMTVAAAKKGIELEEINGSNIPVDDIHLTFEDFCLTVAEFEGQCVESKKIWDQLSRSLSAPFQKAFNMVVRRGTSHKRSHTVESSSPERDIYLGGCQSSSWRNDLVVPILRKHGLSYYSPSGLRSVGITRLLPTEAAHIESSKVLLFVITNCSRAAAQMALAAYYIGLRCNVVLCVQRLQENCVVGGEQLSALAIKDYNRGRTYLTDQANKEGIPIFDNLEEATNCVVHKCKTDGKGQIGATNSELNSSRIRCGNLSLVK